MDAASQSLSPVIPGQGSQLAMGDEANCQGVLTASHPGQPVRLVASPELLRGSIFKWKNLLRFVGSGK
ncbi:hypothetical protein UVI_02016800 [Ustilaginoidea virens]|uniref:Uncharacterized protein n=1 Tax=Ustilaginoidea virens TaxID=1159556 RepID=A0A1B5L027_USTVR|nr:hypothetical protein UVI_02016800 [Ustilaginoidea virens]